MIINTIHAGDYEQGVQTGWRDGALLAGGNYLNINQDHRVVHYQAPQDKKLAELNAQLNQTYIPYGHKGEASVMRQMEQDRKSRSISAGLLAKRAKNQGFSIL